MKANELRVGNWVSKHGEQYQSSSATIVMLERGESDVQPIPITEEWLKNKESFVKEWKGNAADYQPETSKTKQVHYKLFENCYCVFETWSYRKDEYSEWINEHSVFVIYSDNQISLYKHEVHVLQNLIFSLTGEELYLK